MRNNDSLTPLRGVAACLVVLFHYSIFAPNLKLHQMLPFLHRSHLWVDFFFMLSGYVMMLVYGEQFKNGSWKSVGKYYWARLARIYPLHLVVLLILIGLEFLAAAFGQSGTEPFTLRSRSAESIWTNLLLIQAWHLHSGLTWNIPSWSISCEWAAYLLFPFFVGFLRERPARLTWGILIACFALLVIMDHYYGSLTMSFDWGVARCLCSFIAGAALFEILRPFDSTDFSNSSFYVIVLCLPFGALTLVDRMNAEWLAIPVFAVLLAVMSKATCSVRHRLLENRPMFFIGELSYAIYISHWIVQATIPPLFVRFVMANGDAATELQLLLSMTVITFVISYALHVLVEMPARVCLRNFLPKPSPD